MRHLRKWLLRVGFLVVLLAVALGAPVVYVETACQGDASSRPYEALLAGEHHRAEARTLMTYPEWYIVHAYENYAEVIRTGAPHEFGFFKSIAGFWSSLCSVTEKSAELGEINTETKQLVYVIGTSFTAELALKALYEETIGRFFILLRGNRQSTFDKLTADHARDYAIFLQQVPWYKWGFTEAHAELQQTPAENLRDKERRFSIGLEYSAKAAYADVIASAVETTGGDELTLQMVVKRSQSQTVKPYTDTTVINQIAQGTVLETPRYRELTKLMVEMAKDGLDFVEIAGNDQVMFTAISENPDYPGAIASMKRQGFSDHRHLVLVEVSALAEQLRGLQKAGARIEHVHDY